MRSKNVSCTKAKEYASDADRLQNFKDASIGNRGYTVSVSVGIRSQAHRVSSTDDQKREEDIL